MILSFLALFLAFFLFWNSPSMVLYNLLFISKSSVNLSFSMNFYLVYLLIIMPILITILFYCKFYMSKSKMLTMFMVLLLLFFFSMTILISSENYFMIFIGWDGLGISSYFLIIFFLNWKSNNSGFITILSNRIGDGLLMVSLLSFMIFNSNFLFGYQNCAYSLLLLSWVSLFCFTKSAQYPFSFWLPMAMAAPTPISALVHSSTLVTAGVVVLLRFFENLSFSVMSLTILMISLYSMLLSGLASLLEVDLKKMVALSTLNQIGFMLCFLSMNLKILAFFHLMAHALFKSLLFLSVGVLIHLNFSSQDKRSSFSLQKLSNYLVLAFSFSNFNLMGLVFLSGFFSKDLIFDNFIFSKTQSSIISFLISLLIGFTFLYCFSIFKSILFLKSILSTSSETFSISFISSSFMLCFLSTWMGKLIFLNFQTINFLSFSSSFNKGILSFLLLVLLMLASFKKMSKNSHFVFNSLLFLNQLSCLLTKPLSWVSISFKALLEKNWLEIFSFKFFLIPKTFNSNSLKGVLFSNSVFITMFLLMSSLLVFILGFPSA